MRTFQMDGRKEQRLSVLRYRMEKESQWIIQYLDIKKVNKILEDIGKLSTEERMATFPQAGNSKEKPTLLLKDWTWWKRMEGEAECARRLDGKARQAEKERFFSDRIQPNILLTGLPIWWSRMEAEKWNEEKLSMNKVDWTISRAYSNNIKKETFIKEFFPTPRSTRRLREPNSQIEKYAAEVELKCGRKGKMI